MKKKYMLIGFFSLLLTAGWFLSLSCVAKPTGSTFPDALATIADTTPLNTFTPTQTPTITNTPTVTQTPTVTSTP